MDPNQQPNPSEETPTTPAPEVSVSETPVTPEVAPVVESAPVAPEVAPSSDVPVAEPVVVATPVSASPVGPNPGATFGIISFILALLGLGLFGLIFGILGLNKSKRAGQKNILALIGIILGIIEIIFGIFLVVFYYSTVVALVTV